MRRIFACVSLLLYVCSSLWTQHRLGAGVEANIALHLDNIPITTTKLGGGVGLNAVYQFQHKHFIMETGVGFSYILNKVGVRDSFLQYEMIDTKGTFFIYNGYLKDRKDLSKNLSVNFPLMFGVEYNHFYGLVGSKVVFNVFSTTKQTVKISTPGEYDNFYGDNLNGVFFDVPAHGFHDFETKITRGAIKYNMDVRVTMELGAVFQNKENKAKYRIGAFIEYGLLNVRQPNSEKSLIEPDLLQYLNISMNHIYSSSYEESKSVKNILAGIRFSILFSIAKTTRHLYPCRCVPDKHRYK